MIRRFAVLISAFVLLLPALAKARGAPDAREVLSHARDKYESIQDASASFTQQVRFGVMKSEQSFSGRFFMRKGNHYRIEGEEQTIVTDGSTVWTYSSVNKQVLIDRYKDDNNVIEPQRLLVNAEREYEVTLIAGDNAAEEHISQLKLIPNSDTSRFKWVKLWIDRNDWLLKKAQLQDLADNITTYTISNIRLNKGLPDSLFRFDPPRGTEVIDLR